MINLDNKHVSMEKICTVIDFGFTYPNNEGY